MTSEKPHHPDFIRVFEDNYPTNISITGSVPVYHEDLRDVIWSATAELVENYIEEGGGAEINIGVLFEETRLVIKTDFKHKDPSRVLATIRTIQNSGIRQTTKGRPGGFGIYEPTKFFREKGGDVTFSIEDNTIVTQATWDQALLNLTTIKVK